MAFQPGQSGNPGGRSKEDREIKALAREFAPDAIHKLVEWMNSTNAKASVAACQALLDRAFGKPKQAVVGGDEDDAPIRAVCRIELVDLDGSGPSSSS